MNVHVVQYSSSATATTHIFLTGGRTVAALCGLYRWASKEGYLPIEQVTCSDCRLEHDKKSA